MFYRRRCISQDSVGGITPQHNQSAPETRFGIETTTRGRPKKKPIISATTSNSSPLRHQHLAWDDPDIERKKEQEERRRRRLQEQEEEERRRLLDEEEEKERERLRFVYKLNFK